jgi:mRNA interferase RelE/StbE
MVWRISFSPAAEKQFAKLAPPVQQQIVSYLKSRVLTLSDPHLLGKPLRGTMKGLWRYRVENYRIVCELRDSELLVLVLKMGHRRDIYD